MSGRRGGPTSNAELRSMPVPEEILATETVYRCGCARATTSAGYVAEEGHCLVSLEIALRKNRLSRRRRRMDFEDPGLMPLLEEIENLEQEIHRHRWNSGIEASATRPFDLENAGEKAANTVPIDAAP